MNIYKNNSHIINGVVFYYSKPDMNGRVYPKNAMEKDIKELLLRILIKERKLKLKKLKF